MDSQLVPVRVVYRDVTGIAVVTHTVLTGELAPTYHATPEVARQIAADYASAADGGVYDVLHREKPCILALRFERVSRIDFTSFI